MTKRSWPMVRDVSLAWDEQTWNLLMVACALEKDSIDSICLAAVKKYLEGKAETTHFKVILASQNQYQREREGLKAMIEEADRAEVRT
ncbi:MAG: hypothetical protein ACR2M4_02345 [Actinomycetota bacterium]